MNLVLDLLIIFVLRLLDVGMATVRIVLLGKGRRATATALGFFEALIWVLAVAQVLDGLDDPLRMVAFAAGFAAGTYFGSIVEEWIALGQSMLRVVSPVDTPQVAAALRDRGYGATVINGDGLNGEVRITFCVIPRKETRAALALVREANPDAYVTLDSTTSIDIAHRAERTVRR